eukprot:3727006-Rhodomonas_salina.2
MPERNVGCLISVAHRPAVMKMQPARLFSVAVSDMISKYVQRMPSSWPSIWRTMLRWQSVRGQSNDGEGTALPAFVIVEAEHACLQALC